MDNEQHTFPFPPIGDDSTGSPASAARQVARSKRRVWASAITVGVGVAGVLGAAVSSGTLPSAITASSASTSASTSGTSTGSSAQKLQATTAPSTASSSPVATSGAS